LGDTSLEVKRHGESSRELSESHLLSSFGGDRLQKQSSSRSRVEVGKETVDTGFTPDYQHNQWQGKKRRDAPSSESLTEVDKLSWSLEIVSVLALFGSGSSTVQLDVGDQSSVRDFLGTHELDELDIVLGDTSLGEFLDRESVGTVVEEITAGQL
jgi:hypothetical protein